MTFIALGEKQEFKSDNFLELRKKVEQAPDDEGFTIYRIDDKGTLAVLEPSGLFREL